ncbi:MAG: PGF-CTERM sorting domain-containing protein [Methanotrichaceae archaeon]|nr:PGF-CTERM sorting domain-containing protein [Methanotrichaceae archaeon]
MPWDTRPIPIEVIVKAAAENATKKVEAAGAAAGGVAAAEKKLAETKAAANQTPAPAAAKKGMPGFEGVFAIAGLMAIAYLVIGRKQ